MLISHYARPFAARSRVAIAALAFFTLAACGGDSTGPSATESRLLIKNGSTHTIVIVNFSDCSSPTWGPDRLGPDEVIPAAAERSWTVAPGCYDVRVRTAVGSQVWLDQELRGGNTARLTASSFSSSNARLPAQSGVGLSELKGD